MPGPLPQPARRRRNAPTIPTTVLPAGGRTDPAPRLPGFVKLGKAGRAWWKWAWSTPQAAAWALGHEGVVARRASLEDDLDALARVDGIDLGDLIHDEDAALTVKSVVQRLASLATGRLALVREMRELDDRLGLTPKAMAQLRWSIADPGNAPAESGGDGEDDGNVIVPDRWRRGSATG